MSLLNGLVSYYKLDETSGTTAVDSHGSNNGTHTNTTINQAGKIDKAVSYNGSNAETTFSSDLGLGGTAQRSLSFWFKLGSTTQTIWNNMVGWLGTSSNNSFFNVSSNDSNGIGLHLYGTQYVIETNATLGTSNWHHIVITYDGTKGRAYLNGVKKVEQNISPNTNSNFNIANRGGARYNGLIDEIGVWNRPLTDSEILELLNSGNGLTYPFAFGYSLNFNKKGHGSEGGIISLNPDKETYDENETVEISLSTTGENYRFHKFEGDLSGNNNPETIIMDDDKNVDIYFQKRVKIMEGLVF